MTRYIAVPVEYGKTRAGKVWCQVHDIYEKYSRRICGPIRGYGTTEDEAFADLLVKLGYREAITVKAESRDMMDFFTKCVDDYDADEVERGLREFLAECERDDEEEK